MDASAPSQRAEIVCWDGVQRRVDQHQGTGKSDLPHLISISTNAVANDHLDEIENVLGLVVRYPNTELCPRLSPSQAVADPSTPIDIKWVDVAHHTVRVRIDGPWGGKGNSYIYDFDPGRAWLVSRIEIRVFQSEDEQRTDNSRYIMMYTTTQAEQIDGVWMPRQVEMLTRMAEHAGPDALWEEYRATLRLDSISLHPEFTDDDFRISLDGMPDGTSVADARLGISYKLGQNLLYADGVLHELDAPIDHELSASESEALLASSRPMIDPELANINLKPVGGNGLAWAGRIAGGLTVAMCVGIGFVLYRRRA